MFQKQVCVGNYTKNFTPKMARSHLTAKEREGAIAWICELHRARGYLVETMFIAIGIFDKYVSRLDANELGQLDICNFAAVCLLLAAKLNQPLTPSIGQIILLLNKDFKNETTTKR
jgi:hypothetical protein